MSAQGFKTRHEEIYARARARKIGESVPIPVRAKPSFVNRRHAPALPVVTAIRAPKRSAKGSARRETVAQWLAKSLAKRAKLPVSAKIKADNERYYAGGYRMVIDGIPIRMAAHVKRSRNKGAMCRGKNNHCVWDYKRGEATLYTLELFQ